MMQNSGDDTDMKGKNGWAKWDMTKTAKYHYFEADDSMEFARSVCGLSKRFEKIDFVDAPSIYDCCKNCVNKILQSSGGKEA